jgi:ParB-like chromosome segregation protein Spo0J
MFSHRPRKKKTVKSPETAPPGRRKQGNTKQSLKAPLKRTPAPELLEPHPFAALFPELPPEELALLAKDIKERGQLEPIILYKGRILDGRNRYQACQMAGVEARLEEFDETASRRSPEEFILSRNLRRRHLSVGQKAAIALGWSEQIESNPKLEKIKAIGRPRGTLADAAKYIGINEQRVFEIRQIKETDLNLYREVEAGRRSLTSALAEISASRGNQTDELAQIEESASEEVKIAAPQGMPGHALPSGGKVERDLQRPTSNDGIGVKPPPSPAAIEKALIRIKAILGTWFYGEIKARNLVQNSGEIVLLAKLADSEMREVASLLKRGWKFVAAFREVKERLTPDDEIRSLHTRAIENGEKWYLSSIGEFDHVVMWGQERAKSLAKIKETLAGN